LVSLLNDLSGVLRTNARFLRRTQQESAPAPVSASTMSAAVSVALMSGGEDENHGVACSSHALTNAIARVPLQLV
jgi:hypothetical protein